MPRGSINTRDMVISNNIIRVGSSNFSLQQPSSTAKQMELDKKRKAGFD